jgi:hypothetical protein
MWDDNRLNDTVTGRNMEFNNSMAMNVSSSDMSSNMSSSYCPGVAEFSSGYRRVSIAPPSPYSHIRTIILVLSQVPWLEDTQLDGGTGPHILIQYYMKVYRQLDFLATTTAGQRRS